MAGTPGAMSGVAGRCNWIHDQYNKALFQMRSGTSLESRYYQRDKQRPTDKKTSLYGFNQAMLLMDKVTAQLSALQAGTT